MPQADQPDDGRRRVRRLGPEGRALKAKEARSLYLDDKLSIREVAHRLGDWSYGATHRLLSDFNVPLRGRGAHGQLSPRAKRGPRRGSSTT